MRIVNDAPAPVKPAGRGDGRQPAHDWPAWTDAHRYVPTRSDRSWAAQRFEQDERDRDNRVLDLLANASAALDRLQRGLVAPDAV
jgi:hypothetical protein